jgi:hypothetical protein
MAKIKTVPHDIDYVKKNLQAYFEEGIYARDERQKEIDKAQRLFDRVYKNQDLPDDVIFYPTAHNEASEIQRSTAQSFANTDDLTAVMPLSRRATTIEDQVARAQQDIARIKLGDNQWFNKSVFVDRTTQQGVISAPKAFIGWKREREEFEVLLGHRKDIDPDTGEELLIPITRTQTRIVTNRFDPRPVEDANLIWDTNIKEWARVHENGWAMELNIRVNRGQLLRMVDTDDFDPAVVQEMVLAGADDQRDNSRRTKTVRSTKRDMIPRAEDNKTFRLVQFYGWMSLQEDAAPRFVKIVADQEFHHILLKPTEDPRHVYRWLNGKPMVPYVVGYFVPVHNEVAGYPLINKMYELQQEENAMRNFIRRSAEQDLHSTYAIKRGSGLDIHSMQDGGVSTVVWTDVDVRSSMAEFPHRDTTGSGFNDLALLDKDRQRTFGNTDASMGISDPSQNDTATGATLAHQSANQVKFYFISRYGETFYEPVMQMGLELSVQFTTREEYARYNIEIPEGVDRQALYQTMKLKVDTARGAMSVQARKNNAIENFILTQQLIKYMASVGFVLPPQFLAAPLHFYKQVLTFNGEHAQDKYLPPIEEIIALSKQRNDQNQAELSQQQAQERQLAEAAVAEGGRRGAQLAREQLAASGGAV